MFYFTTEIFEMTLVHFTRMLFVVSKKEKNEKNDASITRTGTTKVICFLLLHSSLEI